MLHHAQGIPFPSLTMCALTAASIAVDAGDMTVLEPSGYILTAVAAKRAWRSLLLAAGELWSRIALTAPLPRLSEPPCHDPWPGSSLACSLARTGRVHVTEIHKLSTARRKQPKKVAEGSALALEAAISAAAARHEP
eukprot:3423756-Prymnesium_polylepis.1